MTTVGTELPDWRLAAVDAEKMKVLALLLADPNPLHFDPDAARAAGTGHRPINQGPSNMAMLANLVRAAFPEGKLVRLKVQLRGSVVAGEEVVVRGTVTRDELTGSGDELIRCELVLEAAEHVVLSGEADVIVAE